jgi:hypothetical protein
MVRLGEKRNAWRALVGTAEVVAILMSYSAVTGLRTDVLGLESRKGQCFIFPAKRPDLL